MKKKATHTKAPFRYTMELCDQGATAFLEKMASVERDPVLEKFFREAQEYAQQHPIRKP